MSRIVCLSVFFLMIASVASAQVPEPAPLAAGNPEGGGFVSWVDTSKLVVPAEVTSKVAQPLPASFDWRTTGTTPAKDQGSCGVCWIFAGIGDLESKVKIDGLGERDYSEQQVLDCNPMGSNCATAGNAWGYFNSVYQGCTVPEVSRPYTGVKGTCPPIAAAYERPLQMRTIADDSPGAARDWIKHTIMDEGPVYCAIYSSAAQFQTYVGEDYGMSYPAGILDHAVLIVGWDDNKPYYNTYPGPITGYGCWIIKNSWGTAWGQNGFGYVGYGAAGVANQNSYISEYTDCSTDIGEILRYDHGFGGYFLGYGGIYTPHAAVKYTSTSPEDITGVGFYVPITGAQYEIRLYDNANPATNTWTTQLVLRTGTLAEGGYHMIELAPAIPIPADNDFWIRLRLTDPGSVWQYLVAADTVSPFESAKCYMSSNGATWMDLGGSYDLSVHARIGVPVQPTPTPPATGIEVWEEYR